MKRADAAGADQLLFERGSSPVSAHGGIARFQFVRRGKIGQGSAVEIDLAQNFCIGRFQGGQQLLNAATHDAACELIFRTVPFRLSLQLFGPTFERSVLRVAAARVVNDGVAQDCVEPWNNRAAIEHALDTLESAEIGGLENILRERAVLHTALHECKKGSVAIEQVEETLAWRCVRQRLCGSLCRGGF